MSVEELRKDVAELSKFEKMSERKAVKEALQIAKHKIELEIVNLEVKQKAAAAAKGEPIKPSGSTEVKRHVAELTEYGFDQSDKFVKLFITLKDAQQLKDSDVSCYFTLHSLNLIVHNLHNKDYQMIIKNLLNEINIVESYFKIKNDMIAVYMKKAKTGHNWEHLTSVEKRLKEAKDQSYKPKDADSSDPTSGLMNLMKKMYDDGDSETKRMIAKTWSESMDKKMEHPEL